MKGILSAALVTFATMLAFAPAAHATGTQGPSQTWSACWPGITCQTSGPVTCSTSASSSTCSYAQTGGASVCNYSTGQFNCTSSGAAVCYVAEQPPPPGDITYGNPTFVCYPTAPPSTLSISPGTIGFGEQLVGSSSQTISFNVTNTGGQWVQTSDVYLSYWAAPYRIVSTTCRFTMLNPGQSCSVSVVFSPTAVGNFGTTIELDYTPQGASSTYVLGALAGKGVTQYSAPMLSFSLAQLNMSQTQYGRDSAIYGVTLRNAGPSPAQISGISATDDFSIYSTTCGPVASAPSVNVAAAKMGATAQASSIYGAAGYSVSSVIDSSRTGATWGQDGGWLDGTPSAFPDYVNIWFPDAKTIDRIVVYSIQDNWPAPVEPTDNLTFSAYGLTDFTVYGLNNGSWVVLGTVSANKLVKRTVTFAPIAVTAISVNISATSDGWSRIAEIEAWTPASTASGVTTLQNGGQCTIYGRFTPTALGQRTGSIQVESNAVGSPNLLPLSGNGVGAVFASQPVDGSNAGAPQNTDNIGTSVQTSFTPDDRSTGSSSSPSGGGPGGPSLKDDVHDGGRIDVYPPSWCEAFPEDCSNDPDFGSSLPRQHEQQPKEPRDADECQADASGIAVRETLLAQLHVRDDLQRRAERRDDIGTNLMLARAEYVLDPIHAGNGNKYHVQRDYRSAGRFGLDATRTFNSQAYPASAQRGIPLGTGWFLNWDRSVRRTANSAVVTRGDGKSYQFNYNSATGGWDPVIKLTSKLEHVADSAGAIIGWRYTTRARSTENFDGNGRLTSIVLSTGHTFTLAHDAYGRLSAVTGPFGRRLAFAYDTHGRLSILTDPANGQTTYGYDARGRLALVSYPDGRSRQYQYNDPNNVFALTSVLDELGQVYATFSYDDFGRATGNSFIGGVGAGSIAYSATNGSSVTTPDGTVWTRGFAVNNGLVQMTTLTPACATCGAGSEQFSYDLSGLLTSHIDRSGTQTSISYNDRGLVTSMTEGAGQPSSRVMNITWHPTYAKPIQVSQTGSPTRSFQYDAQGRITQESVSDGVTARTTTYAYNAQGLLAQIDGPRTDVSDVTSFTYDATGNIATITNAKGHVTRYNSYDAHGRPLSFTFPDGTTGTMAYDARGRVTSKSRAGRTTSYTYNAFGQLATETDPSGVATSYIYDAAHRLVGVDKAGEKVRYTLDNSGRTTKIETFDDTNFLASTSSAEYDGLGRLTRTVGAKGQITTYSYDANGNLTQTVNANGAASQVAFDSLNRPYLFTNAIGAQVRKTLDAQGRLTSVQDAIGAVTSFAYSTYGEIVQMQSADAGTSTLGVDASSNVTAQTDSAGLSAQFTYDAIGRQVQAVFSGMPGTTFTYDVAANGVGQLAQVADSEAVTSFTYDGNARTASITQTTGAVSRSIVYGRDTIGRITSMRYPSGRTLAFSYANDRVVSITLDGIPVVTGVQYFPFGNAESWIFGHGAEYTRYLDTDKRIARYLVPGGDRALTYDPAGRLVRIVESLGGTARSQALAYDAVGRLTSFQGFTSAAASETESFTYDANGNRSSRTLNGVTESYSYVSGTNRIAGSAVNGAASSTYAYDGRGSVISDGTRTYAYLANGRLGAARYGYVTYGYNWAGLRVRKTVGGQPRYFMYDEGLRLIGEYDAAGNAIQEYVWLGAIPVAVSAVLPGSGSVDIGYIWTDHLNTPRIVTRETAGSMQRIWSWDPLPFGETAANGNPSGIGTFSFNLRFPGQYFDEETELHYNGQRDYDPKSGRYLTVDVKGADQGVNRFIYALADPILNVDPKGEDVWRCDRGIGSATNPILRLPRMGPAFHQFVCVGGSLDHATCQGISAGLPINGEIEIQAEQANGASCELVSRQSCMDRCVLASLAAMSTKPFDIRSSVDDAIRRRGNNNCQTGVSSVLDQCSETCAKH